MSRSPIPFLLLVAAAAACGGPELTGGPGEGGGAGHAATKPELINTIRPIQGLGTLPGEFAFRTYLKQDYVTAVGGGGRTVDVIHTDATVARGWEKFKILVEPSTGQYAFQTATGNYVTAVGGGGQTVDPIHTDATQVQGWEKFRLWSQGEIGYHAIQTLSGNYLTALGGGGHADPPAVHTDATQVQSWEYFQIFKCGDIGDGYEYALLAPPGTGYFVEAVGGGNETVGALFAGGVYGEHARFKFIRQPDGSYALQTSDGQHYLTADHAGGQPASGTTLQTNRTAVNAWERFWIVDQGDCSYGIQTVSGYYVGPPSNKTMFPTNWTGVTDANKYRLVPVFQFQ